VAVLTLAAVARIRRKSVQHDREFDMTTMGILIWFIAMIIGFFIGMKMGAA
jgi:hypothetical protein